MGENEATRTKDKNEVRKKKNERRRSDSFSIRCHAAFHVCPHSRTAHLTMPFTFPCSVLPSYPMREDVYGHPLPISLHPPRNCQCHSQCQSQCNSVEEPRLMCPALFPLLLVTFNLRRALADQMSFLPLISVVVFVLSVSSLLHSACLSGSRRGERNVPQRPLLPR